jgi:hypothetical protein
MYSPNSSICLQQLPHHALGSARQRGYFISDRPLFKRLENFLDSKDFYFSCEPVFNDRDVLKGHSVNMKLKDHWEHVQDTSLKNTEKIKKTYFSTLLNAFEQHLVFGK